jgi:hypothetical protein
MGAQWQTSIDLALLDVHSNPNILPNFEIFRHVTTFGILVFSSDFVLSQMRDAQPQLGVAVDNNTSDRVFMEMFSAYNKLGI